MTKDEMKRAAFAVSCKTLKSSKEVHLDYLYLGEEFNIDSKEIDENNIRFDWCLDLDVKGFLDFSTTDEMELVEASMLLSEASREDFEYQESEC